MNQQQRYALDHHCRLASECVQAGFGRDQGHFSVVVTVNSGYE